MKLILQAIKSLFRKFEKKITKVSDVAESALTVAESALTVVESVSARPEVVIIDVNIDSSGNVLSYSMQPDEISKCIENGNQIIARIGNKLFTYYNDDGVMNNFYFFTVDVIGRTFGRIILLRHERFGFYGKYERETMVNTLTINDTIVFDGSKDVSFNEVFTEDAAYSLIDLLYSAKFDTDKRGEIFNLADKLFVLNGFYHNGNDIVYYKADNPYPCGLILMDDSYARHGVNLVNGEYYYVISKGIMIRGRDYWISFNNGIIEDTRLVFDENGVMTTKLYDISINTSENIKHDYHFKKIAGFNSCEDKEINQTYIITLTAEDGYTISSVTVIMGDEDITATAYTDGVVTITNPTNNVIITATEEIAA